MSRSLHYTFLLISFYNLATTARAVSMVVHLDKIAYYIPSSPMSHSSTFGSGQHVEPCTVVTLPKFTTAEKVERVLNKFARIDDVWSPEFLSSVILQTADTEGQASAVVALLRARGNQNVYFYQPEGKTLPDGPYFLNNGTLYPTYRLYADTAGAFVVGTVPADDNGTYKALDVAAYGETHPNALTVAVPSRIYSQPTAAKPYAGKRVGIKDTMDLKGLKTGASSKAYTALYPVKESSAEVVQKLIDYGFVAVGKMKSTQFADSEWPTCDYVDYHAPFNPRGDGYLTTSGSSSGSAAGVAAYDWLDFAIGSDSLGSLRAPAAAQAVFSMRPSLGSTSFKGIIPYSPKFDTVGGFARTAAEFKTLARALYGSSVTAASSKKPTRLLYPTDYWPVRDEASQKVFSAFIARLESFLGVKRTLVNLEDIWEKTRPEGVYKTLEQHFDQVFEWGANPDQWNYFLKDFLKDYQATFGKPPVLNPQIRFKTEYLPTITLEQQTEALKLLNAYYIWFYEHVIPMSVEGASETLIVLPWTNGEPDYRDRYREGPQNFTGAGYFFYNIAGYAQAPEILIPVGTTEYESKFTGAKERLPAALGLVAAKGSDVWLAELVSELFEKEEDMEWRQNHVVQTPMRNMEL